MVRWLETIGRDGGRDAVMEVKSEECEEMVESERGFYTLRVRPRERPFHLVFSCRKS